MFGCQQSTSPPGFNSALQELGSRAAPGSAPWIRQLERRMERNYAKEEERKTLEKLTEFVFSREMLPTQEAYREFHLFEVYF